MVYVPKEKIEALEKIIDTLNLCIIDLLHLVKSMLRG